jgi:hypothetical protein
VRLVAQAPGERVHESPAPHPLSVEPERIREHVQAPGDDPPGLRLPEEPRPPVSQIARRVEGRLADERLRVDREPRRPFGREDVTAVQVLVADDELGLRPPELPRETDALVDDRARDRAVPPLPAPRQLFRPALGLLREQPERVARRRRPPQRAEDRRDRLECGFLRRVPEPRPRPAALDQERAARRV